MKLSTHRPYPAVTDTRVWVQKISINANGGRSPWSKAGKLCRRKLPFEFWIYMKSEGAPQDSDATYIWKECLKPRNIGLVELTIPEVSGLKRKHRSTRPSEYRPL